MITVSSNFLAAVRAPHNIAISASVQPPDGSAPIDLPIQEGTVTIDRFADQRRRLELTIANPLLYPLTTSDPVNVYGSTITVSRGIRFANEENELVQLGIFRIEDMARDIPASGGAVTVTGWDLSRQVADQRFLHTTHFAAQQATDFIKLLIKQVFPDLTDDDFDVQTADDTQIEKHAVDRDRWPEVQRVSTMIGCETYVDEMGVWVIADSPDPTTAVSVWDVNSGPDGVLVKATNTVSREGAPSIVVALGESFTARRANVTISHASPCVVSLAKHEAVVGQQLKFHTGGTLPDPLLENHKYWISSLVDADSFHISGSKGGSNINTTTNGSGTFNIEIQSIPIRSHFPHGYDNNPLSPTYYAGAYGEVPRFYSNPHIKVQSKADRVADVQLANHLGATRLVQFDTIANPALTAGDTVTVKYPDGTSERHIIDALTIPLTSTSAMTAETRALDWVAE